MRALLVLLCLWCAGALAAQERQARIELDDGRVVVGRVVQVDNTGIALRVDDRVVAFRNAQIRSCHFEEVEGEAPAPPAAPGVETSPAPVAAPDDAPAEPEGPHRTRALWDSRLHAFEAAFPWLVPKTGAEWFSLGLTTFVLLAVAVHIAARLSATDRLGFGRAIMLASWFLVSTLLQVALVPNHAAGVALVLLANVGVAVALFQFAYGLSTSAAGLAVFLLGLETGLCFAILRLTDATFKNMG
jgi:hypothetical protein